MRWRSKVAPFLDHFGGLDLAAALTKPLGRRSLAILMYHRVAVPGSQPLLSDRVISATPDEFEEQMAWLVRFAHPIGFRDLLRLEKDGEPIPRRAVIVTFDDGYLDNYLCAFSVLRRYRIPATIFLVTGLVGTREPFWWDYVHAALSKEGKSDTLITGELEKLKCLSDEERRKTMAGIAERAGLSLSAFPRTIINWDEARAMQEDDIDFGGHTVTHPILSRLPPAALEEEIRGCRAALEKELQKEPIAFAYPVGRTFALADAAFSIVEKTGFRYAVTTEYGRNVWPLENRYRLRRLDVGLADSLARFKAKLLVPAAFRPKAGTGYSEAM
ncbi:MAG: polysaccharide deacetylase family protein [Pseudomonadota bacterium]